MEVKKRDRIFSSIVINSDMYNDDDEYIKGFFYDKDDIKTNKDFLECLACSLYWNVDFPDMLIDYSKKPNYNSLGLINDIILVNKHVLQERSCDELIDNIKNSSFEPQQIELSDGDVELCTNIINDDEIENKYLHLIETGLSKFTQYFINNGVDMEDVLFDETDAVEGYRVLSIMLDNGFEISIELLYHFITNGFGSIVKKCFEHKSSDIFVDDLPIDHETLQFFKLNTNLNKDKYQEILHNLLELKRGSISFLIDIYELSEITSKNMKLNILTSILNFDNKLLSSLFIREIFESGVSAGDIYCNIYTLNKNIIGYMIYQLSLISNSNLELIYRNVKNLIQENKKNEYTIDEIYDAEFDSSDCDEDLSFRQELQIKNDHFDNLLSDILDRTYTIKHETNDEIYI